MKRFLVFCCETYYPKGGMDDFIGDFDTIEDAISELYSVYDNISYSGYGHIYDTETKVKVKTVG